MNPYCFVNGKAVSGHEPLPIQENIFKEYWCRVSYNIFIEFDFMSNELGYRLMKKVYIIRFYDRIFIKCVCIYIDS